jgi:hypothetical protein
VAASDALVGEGLSISPWKEALAERDALAVRLAELTGKRCVWVPAKSFRHASCYATSCGDYFSSNYSNPTNMGYRFCPYCGGRIELEGK